MSDEWQMNIGTWEDAERLVGTVIETYAGADAVNLADIRRRLEVLAWDAPIHHDAETARRAGFEGIVSPATMILSWALPAYWSPGDERPRADDGVLMPGYPFPRIPAPGTAVFAVGCRTTYLAPLYPGDRVAASAVLKSLTRKDLRIGPGAFMVVETTYINQNAETIAIEEMTVYRYTPPEEDGTDDDK